MIFLSPFFSFSLLRLFVSSVLLRLSSTTMAWAMISVSHSENIDFNEKDKEKAFLQLAIWHVVYSRERDRVKTTLLMNNVWKIQFFFFSLSLSRAHFKWTPMFSISSKCRRESQMVKQPDKGARTTPATMMAIFLPFSSLLSSSRFFLFIIFRIHNFFFATGDSKKRENGLSRPNKGRLNWTEIQCCSFSSRSSTTMGKGSKNSHPSVLAGDHREEAPSSTTNESMISSNSSEPAKFTWEEIRQHSKKHDRWLVIDRRVYDVTRWLKHPGGQAVLNHYAGQDATVRQCSAIRSITKIIILGSVLRVASGEKFRSKISEIVVHWGPDWWRREQRQIRQRWSRIERRFWEITTESHRSGKRTANRSNRIRLHHDFF